MSAWMQGPPPGGYYPGQGKIEFDWIILYYVMESVIIYEMCGTIYINYEVLS